MAYQISRLYDFQAGTRILSKQVDDELNQIVLSLNNQDVRIDNILNTPVETVSAEEIIDARNGQANLRARLDQLVTMDGLRAIATLTVGTRESGSSIGIMSGSVGYNNDVSGHYAFSAGSLNESSGLESFTQGRSNKASAVYTAAMGNNNIASGQQSQAIGQYNTAAGVGSKAIGDHLVANGYHQIVLGRYNQASGTPGSFVATDYGLIIGNGLSGMNFRNALTMDWNGQFRIVLGSLTFVLPGRGPIVRTPDDSKSYLLGVDNAGAITTTLIT